MRKLILLLACGFTTVSIHAQLFVSSGATFFIQTGATVTVQGDVTSNADIQGTGLLQLKGSANQNVNMNGFTIPNLEMDNAANATLTGNATIGSTMTFTNGRIQLGNFNMTINSAATITGANSSRFFITNGTGSLTRQSLGAAFQFPVGFSSTEYNPLTITNSGTPDNVSVRCLQNVLDNGLTGSPVASDFANNSWVVSEATPGGSNLSMTTEWVGSDELPGFNRAKSAIARYNAGTDWDLPANTVAAAAGAGPYTRSLSNITNTGVFAVADLDKVNTVNLNLKVFLAGPYSGTQMTDALRLVTVIPTTQPYSSALSTFFNRAGSIYDGTAGVNETVPSTAVFDVAAANDDIVDWVFISLNDGTTPATRLQTRAALIQRDGDIVEYNTLSGTYIPVKMPINGDGNYHLVVGHRNHLAIRTAVAQLLQDNATFSYDFTTALGQAYNNPAITANAQMRNLSGVYAMWSGDVNSNGVVRFTGLNNDAAALLTALGGNQAAVLSNVYNRADINMNGVVRYTGLNNDAAALLSSLSGVQSASYSQHQ